MTAIDEVRVVKAVIETTIYLGPSRDYDVADLESQIRTDLEADPAAFFLEQVSDLRFVSLHLRRTS